MSLYGVMRTSTSGMNAQSNRISAVAENVANSNTTGYKSIRSEFTSYFISGNVSQYNSGYVDASMRRLVGSQGSLAASSSATDLAIQGDGFFIVQNDGGVNMLTRSGSFRPDAGGKLVNSAGLQLMGYKITPTQNSIVVNGFAGLEPVTFDGVSLTATASTSGVLQANLPSTATIVPAANLPSSNTASAAYTAKTSMVVYGNLGEEVMLDIYYSKTATGQWEVATFDRAQVGANGFPYGAGPISTATLDFDLNTGQLLASSTSQISIAVPGGQTLSLNLAGSSQLATGFTVQNADVNGNKASSAELVEIDDDGVVFVAFEDGTRQALYRLPLATVPSVDNLEALSGNAFGITSRSGDFRIGFSGESGLGDIRSGVLEQSTADIAAEFADMIDAQRTYTANSKVFQTGAELMDVLVNLKR